VFFCVSPSSSLPRYSVRLRCALHPPLSPYPLVTYLVVTVHTSQEWLHAWNFVSSFGTAGPRRKEGSFFSRSLTTLLLPAKCGCRLSIMLHLAPLSHGCGYLTHFSPLRGVGMRCTRNCIRTTFPINGYCFLFGFHLLLRFFWLCNIS
jgi:hypothetical protein